MYEQLMAGYGTDMRPKNLLKNVKAAHDRIWNKFQTKKYAQKRKIPLNAILSIKLVLKIVLQVIELFRASE